MTLTADDLEYLSAEDAAKLTEEYGTAFGAGERLFGSFLDDDVVSLAWDTEPAKLADMLADDGNARKIERVLSLPIRGAQWHIIGAGPGVELVRDNLGPMLGRIIEQCTKAIVYRRAFFEKVFGTDAQGRTVYQKVAWRPPNACTARFDRATGEERGFYQRITDIGWWKATQGRPSVGARARYEEIPGQVTIPAHKAFVYVHGRHSEPVKGVSDLEVAYNAWQRKRKILFLFGKYLETQALPQLAVFGPDTPTAVRNAEQMAKARAGSIIPWVRGPDEKDPFAVIESSGRGAAQFIEAVRYFDWVQTNSVLAGFTELANSSSGTGSYALSSDQSEFFLASEQALADEIADQVTEGLIRPLVEVNYGEGADIPGLTIGPIGRQQTDRALNLLQKIIGATRPTVPYEFTGRLLIQVADQLGIDVSEVEEIVAAWGGRMQDEIEAAIAAQLASAATSPLTSSRGSTKLEGMTEAQAAAAKHPDPPAAGPAPQPPPADQVAPDAHPASNPPAIQQKPRSAPGPGGANTMKAPVRHLSERDRRRRRGG